jgi:hypothetical protein
MTPAKAGPGRTHDIGRKSGLSRGNAERPQTAASVQQSSKPWVAGSNPAGGVAALPDAAISWRGSEVLAKIKPTGSVSLDVQAPDVDLRQCCLIPGPVHRTRRRFLRRLQVQKNSIGSRQLKRNAVTTAKVKSQAITAAKIKNGTLTGTQSKPRRSALYRTRPTPTWRAALTTPKGLGERPPLIMRGSSWKQSIWSGCRESRRLTLVRPTRSQRPRRRASTRTASGSFISRGRSTLRPTI